MDGGRIAVGVLREVLQIPMAGEESDAHEDSEHDFRSARVHDREPVAEKLENGEATEDALEDDATDSDKAQFLEPGAFVVTPEKIGEEDDPDAENGAENAMGMFNTGTAVEQTERWEESAEGGGPIRDRKSGVVGSHESASGEEHGRPSDYEQGVFVNARMKLSHHEFRAPNTKTFAKSLIKRMFPFRLSGFLSGSPDPKHNIAQKKGEEKSPPFSLGLPSPA